MEEIFFRTWWWGVLITVITSKIVEGTRGPFYTIGRSFLPTAETLRRTYYYYCKLIPKAQHRSCTMV